MISRRSALTLSLAAIASWPISRLLTEPAVAATKGKFVYTLSEAEWRKKLDRNSYAVLREEKTESPYSSPLNSEKRTGTFVCKGCALPLFSSRTKYDSGTGWPSFWQPLKGVIGTQEDNSIPMMPRTEVHCARCGGHLGHVFDDGPKPTGMRYCMNGLSLTFQPAKA